MKLGNFLKGANATDIHSIFNPLLQQSLVHHNSPWRLWLAVQITEHFCKPITAHWWQQSVPLGEGRAEGKWKSCSWARHQLKQHLLSCSSPAGSRECHRNVANTSNSSGNAHSRVTNPLGMLPGSPPEPAQEREPGFPPHDLPHT